MASRLHHAGAQGEGRFTRRALIATTIRSLLFGVSPLDPIAFLLPAAVLLPIGVLAAAVPAVRAAAVPPVEALKAV